MLDTSMCTGPRYSSHDGETTRSPTEERFFRGILALLSVQLGNSGRTQGGLAMGFHWKSRTKTCFCFFPLFSRDFLHCVVFSCYMILHVRDSLLSFIICVQKIQQMIPQQPILVGGLEHFLFFHILGIIIPTDFHIFQRG